MIRILKIGILIALFISLVGISAFLVLTMMIKSEDTVIIPQLVGKDIVYALEILGDLGLNTKVKGSEYNADIPKNHIIFQDPEPGAEIKQGRDVKLILSKGTKEILIPNLQGLALDQARIILEENELCYGNTALVPNHQWAKDVIIAQSPPSGKTISRGACVSLLVSSGEVTDYVTMPDLLGYSLDRAVQMMEQNNFSPGQIKSQYAKDKPLDTIIGQEPLSGYRTTSSIPVNLVINRIPKAQSSPQSLEGTGLTLIRYQLDNGFLNQHVRARISRKGYAYNILDGFFRPGTDVWLLIPQGQRLTLVLYIDNQPVKTQLID
ncbi:MAG: PASTA domain-containing protein [Desulfobacteraceae bacterium]|jgi:serine/threonine-protein kinase